MRMLKSRRRLRMATLALGPLIGGVVAFFAVSAGTGSHPVFLRGVTAQGNVLNLRIDGDGNVTSVTTRVSGECGKDREWSANWAPKKTGPRARFRQDDNAVTITDIAEPSYSDGTKAVVAFSAQGIVPGNRRTMDGFVRMTVRFRQGGKLTTVCESGPVRFATGKGALKRLDAWL